MGCSSTLGHVKLGVIKVKHVIILEKMNVHECINNINKN